MITINLSDYAERMRAKHAAECREWYRKNRSKINATQRERNKRADVKAKLREYRVATRTRTLEWRKQYTKTEKYAAWRDAHELRVRYGLTPEERDAMLEAQQHQCAVCCVALELRGRGPTAACVDHDHATARVRRILCRLCNTGLGAFKDNPELLRAAIAYLERHRA